MDHPRKINYRTGLFDPSNLASSSKIDSALLEFGAVINRTNYAEVFSGLFEKKNIVALVLSGIDNEIPLKEWILDDFPFHPKDFSKSFAYELLRELCAFFLFYCSSADAETASVLRRHNKFLHHGSEVLNILQNTSFLEELNSERSPPSSPTKKRAKRSQRDQKQAKKLARESLSVDHKPFIALDFTVPANRDEADSLSNEVWMNFGAILDVLLSGIRRPEVIDVIRTLFIPQERPEELAVAAKSDTMVEESVPSLPSPHATEGAPPLYPVAQPMTVSLYFDPPDDFGKWRILLGKAESDLRHWKRRDSKMYLIIMKKLKELSCGFFSNDNQKRLCGPNTDLPVFEAKMTRDLRLVYSVDCITDYDNHSEIQALRVYGIFTHSQMDYRLWECVSRYLSSHSKEYRERCLARRLHPDGGNIYLPKSFPESSQPDEPVEFNPLLPADDANQLHHIVSLEKYVMLSKSLLESIENNKDANFPFEVSKKERIIIEHPNSCYVLGRSGTGKTTTMLFKVLLIERDYQLSEKLRQRPRQMFVTQSRALVAKVEELFMTYLSSLSFASHLDEPVARGNMNISDRDDIFNAEDDTEWRNDLPDKFSALEDGHFPLFIAFDSLCAMIEADINATPSESLDSNSHTIDLFGTARSARKGKLVTYDRFLAEYCPRFEQSRFHPLTIFNEIMGVIAGSEGSLLSPNGYLDRESYIKLSTRMYPVFSEHRETTYGMFMLYLKRKKELDDYDFADRTHAIIRSMVKKSFALQKVSHLYVDETQDNLLIDIFLLRLLCGNSDGLFWAGDTAQTISAGSSFRFNDLKAFLYRLQKTRLDQETLTPMRLKEPRMFFLAVNYRSHAGIVNCAHSIVELINKYWKNSIDSLPRERGNAHGAMPIFYTDINPEFVQKGHFLSRDRILHGKVRLGADQCILVRDAHSRDRLKREVGDDMFEKLGIVITLYDSKGQEFDDVFLYNFFHDSLVDNAWRLMLNDVSHYGIGQSRIAAPQFDKTRHGTLCSELKCLYVAVTRARNNLRIADESSIGEPMRAIWESRGQILSCKPGQESTDFARASNEEQWANRAKLFFDNGQWEHAKNCYERAGKKQGASVADAYLQRERARRIPSEGRGKARKSAFLSGANAFKTCSQNANNILAKNKYMRLYAGCLEEVGETQLEKCAAEVYRQGNWVSDASRIYRKLGMFNEIFDIVTQSDASLVATIPESILDVTRLHFVSRKEYKKAHRLFNSVEAELDYLEGRSLHDAQVDLFVRHGQNREAADLHLSEGRTQEALDLYLQDNSNVHGSLSRANQIILKTLWQLSPFGVTPAEHGKMRGLLERAKDLILAGVMDVDEKEEVAMFYAILNGPQTKLPELADSFLKRGNQHAALHCYDHYFEHLPPLIGEDIKTIVFDLRQFSDYVRILRDFVFLDDPARNPRTCKLFGIRDGEERGTIVLLKPNILYLSSNLPEKSDSKGNLVLSQERFLTELQQCLRTRLLDRVTRENETCRKTRALKPPCVHHIIFKKCNSSPCDFSHISPDPVWFQHWVKAHLLQIEIYNNILGIQYPREFRAQQRFWLVKLYEALNPAHHDFAPPLMNLDVVALPKAVNTLTEWVRAVSFELEFHPESQFLTFAMQTADFAFSYDRDEAENYMSHCKFVTSELSCPSKFYRKPRINSLQEMLMSWNHKNLSNSLMGIQFICHVLERHIPVNIHVFCSFIERVCSMLIVCNHLGRKGNLDSIILPRTWLKASLKSIDVEDAKCQNTFCFWYLLPPLERLIHILYFPPAPGKFQFKIGPEFHTLEMRSPIFRGLFIARICRVLGLLGSNISVEEFRNQILNVFTSLRQEVCHHELDPRFPFYKDYFNAETFKDVHIATRRSMHNALFDVMVRLWYSEQYAMRPRHQISGLRDIVYSTHEELPSLLDAMEHSTPPDFSGVSTSRVDRGDFLAEEADGHDDQVLEEMDEAASEIHDLLPDTEIPEGLYTGHSDQDNHAASVIQRGWSKYLEKKRDKTKPGHESSARRWFMVYRKALPDMQPRSSPLYLVYFLGPLPNLQAALDSIQPVMHKAKEFLKKKLVGINHEDLDEIDMDLTRINKAIKNLKRRQEQLKPNSVLHSDCNIGQLKKEVKDVFNIIDDIRPLLKMPDDLQEAFKTVSKVVLLEHKSRISLPTSVAKARRPRLVMEDLQELIQDTRKDI